MSGQHAYFDYDNAAFGALAVDALVARGRKNIALLAPPSSQTYSIHMVTGAQKAAEAHNISVSAIEGATSHSTIETIEEAIRALFSRDDPPDALIAPSIGGCVTMVSTLERMGLVLEHDFDMAAKEALSLVPSRHSGAGRKHWRSW